MRQVKVTCRLCKATGMLLTRERPDGFYDMIDKVKHKHDCPKNTKRKNQPAHLRMKHWRAQERMAAKSIGGHETPLSGALNEDGDARRMKGRRIECKRTKTDRYRLSQAVWNKLVVGAGESGEEPAMFIDLKGGAVQLILVRAARGLRWEPTPKGVTIQSGTFKYGDILELSPKAKILTSREFRELVKKEDNNENERDFRTSAEGAASQK